MPKKILIIKWGAIGDVIMSLPATKKLKESYPHHQIYWVMGNNVKSLIKALEIADKLISFSERDLFQKNIFSKFITLYKIWKKIGFRKFDKIYILHKDIRYSLLSLFSFGKKIRLKQNINFFSTIYHAKQYLSLVDSKAKIHYPKPIFPLKEEFISLFHKGPYIFIAAGGAINPLKTDPSKRWPIGYYTRLCEKLLLKGFTIVLIGDNNDKWVLPYFSHLQTLDLVGKTSLLDLVALFNKGHLLITHDTGVMHLAKLSSIKICALFGPTNPKEFTSKTKQILALYRINKGLQNLKPFIVLQELQKQKMLPFRI